MTSFLENAKIGTRILVALLLPILGLLAFSGFTVVNKQQTASEMASLQKLAELAPVVSALVHELQKERGKSAVFINSKGRQLITELPQQRKLTNEKRRALADALKVFDVASFGPKFVSKVEETQRAISRLDDIRTQVSSLSTSISNMAGYYSSTISNLLGIVENMESLSSNARLTQAIVAYTSFLQGKERAGQERAMGGIGFGTGKFKPAIFNKFITLIGQQKTYLSIFAVNATAEQKAFLKSTLAGPVVDDVNRMRKIAIDSVVTNDLKGVTGPYWFATITKKINLLKKVEDKIASDLQNLAENIQSVAQRTFYSFLVLTAVLLSITIALVVVIVRSITGPLGKVAQNMTDLAAGNSTIEIEGVHRSDEIGTMANAVQVFKENKIEAEHMAEEHSKEQALREKRSQALESLSAEFETSVSGVLSEVSTATQSMKTIAEGMSETAEKTTSQATAVASAAEEASTNVQTVASAAEELSSSINEISRQVSTSTSIAGKAVQDALSTDEQIQGLAQAASKIGEVVALITEIADQTNLLALNATIEAARAGDAGKGFAVVATEVKNLASQTARATEEISTQIGGIQSATQEAVRAIQEIGKTIGEIDEIGTGISAAVEEQGAATQEIARNVEQAAAGTQEVTSNITGVNRAADETGQAANQVLEAVGILSMQSENLTRKVETFIKDIKAA